MEELALHQPELIGREEELNKLKQSLDNAIAGKGSTIFISGEAGIGKTRLVSELIKDAESKNVQVIQGWCLAESLEPLMSIKLALRDAGLYHLISGDPPPLIVSTYLMDDSGILIAKSEREELELDAHIFSSMLNAVGSFVKDSMQMVDKEEISGGLNILGYQDYKIIIEEFRGLHLASVTKGSLSEFLVSDMKEVLSEVQKRYGHILEDWDGDLDNVEGVEGIVSGLVTSGKYHGKFLVDDAKIKQENLHDNLLLGFQRLSASKPLLLFLDDLHWADPSSLTLLHYMARNTRDYKILLLGSYRPEDVVETFEGKTHQLETAMQNMNREDLLDKIVLNRLGPEDTGKIITSALGKTSFDELFLHKIYKETGGTPFFILEVVKLLMEDGSISQNDDGSWVLKAKLEELDVPTKVYDVVKRRLDRLMKEQRRILDYASVVGEEFQSELVGMVMGFNKLQLLENLSEIERSHKLIHSIEKRYVFDHAKIREVLYNGIMEELKQEYHRIVGDTMAEIHKGDLDGIVSELAYHYYEAGDERASGYLVKAGDLAQENYANEEAIKFYLDALTFPNPESKVEILEKLGDVQVIIGEYDLAIGSYEKVIDSARDNEAKARNLRKIGKVLGNKGEFDKSLEIIANAKELVEKGTAEHNRILLGEGYPYMWKGDFDKAMPLFLEAVKTSEKLDRRDVGNALRAVGNIHLSKGEPEEALQYFEKSLTLMKDIDDQYGIAGALNNIGIVYYNNDDLEKALEYYTHTLVTIEKIGDKSGLSMSLLNVGNAHLGLGNLDKALEYYEQCLSLRKKLGNKSDIAMTLNTIGIVHTLKGDMETAVEFFEQSLDLCLEVGNDDQTGYVYSGLAEAYHGLGLVEKAIDAAEKGLAMASPLGAKVLEGMCLRVLGMVQRDLGEWDRAHEEFEKANCRFEEAEEKMERSKSDYEHALLFKAKGDPIKAKEYLEKALSEFERMGMKLWVEKCRKALEDL